MPSILCSWPVKNLVQNARMDDGELRSHCSAKICSFEKVDRRRVIRMETLGESMGYGESAMM